jgi:hypothetical protein
MEKDTLQGIQVDVQDDSRISVAEALEGAGGERAEYVRVRTRSEVAWLRLVSEWFDQEAQRLDRELATARA